MFCYLLYINPIVCKGCVWETCTVSWHCSLSFSQASQPDELTIDEHEMLEVIEDGDMEDWVKVI